MTEPKDRIYNFYSSFEGGRTERLQDGPGARLKLHTVIHDGKELPALEYIAMPIIVSSSYTSTLPQVLERTDKSLRIVLWQEDKNDFVMRRVTEDNDGYYSLIKINKNATDMTPGYHGNVYPKSHKRRHGQSKNATQATSKAPTSTAHTRGKMCIQCAFLST
eukprot:799843-Rhodomonas_salina.1